MRRNVKQLLIDARESSELMVDLAYAAVFFDDDDLGQEVLRLEEQMDVTLADIRILCMLATRSPEDAEQLAGILGLANAMETIADAAEDIARVVLKDIGVPGELRDDLRHAEEVLARVKLRDENELDGQSLRELGLPSETGMWVIAIRRGVEFIYGPSGGEVLQAGDVLFLQGAEDGIDLVRQLAGGEPYGLAPPAQRGRLSNLDRAVDIIVEMKNAAEMAVGLAYAAILFRDRGLVGEVASVEDRCDDLYNELQRWTLRAARDLDDDEINELRGLLQIGASSEAIADAAREMTRLVEQDDYEVHPVVAVALQSADEIVTDAVVGRGSGAEGRSVKQLSLETETGMYVLGIQRGGRWISRTIRSRELQVGDRLLATGPEEGAVLLRDIVGDPRDVELPVG